VNNDTDFTQTESYDKFGARASHKIQSGYFKISGQRVTGRYTYVPSNVLLNPNFSFDDVFGALGLAVPNLIFEINGSQDPEDWNLRLPTYKTNLIGSKIPESKKLPGPLEHYIGVVKENCKRLLKGTATACEQVLFLDTFLLVSVLLFRISINTKYMKQNVY